MSDPFVVRVTAIALRNSHHSSVKALPVSRIVMQKGYAGNLHSPSPCNDSR